LICFGFVCATNMAMVPTYSAKELSVVLTEDLEPSSDASGIVSRVSLVIDEQDNNLPVLGGPARDTCLFWKRACADLLELKCCGVPESPVCLSHSQSCSGSASKSNSDIRWPKKALSLRDASAVRRS